MTAAARQETSAAAPLSREQQDRVGPGGPAVQRWLLAARLRDLRQTAQLTLGVVAAKTLISPAKLSRLEHGERPVSLRDVRDLAEVYGLDLAQTSELMDLARGALARGWWQDLNTLPEPEKTYLGLEAAACSVRAVDLLQVHGLLQVPAYTVAMLQQLGPWTGDWTRQRYEQVAQARASRQRRLTDPEPLRVDIVIGQAALLTATGSAQVMVAQVSHLLQVGSLANVRLRVLPFTAGTSAAHAGSFGLLDFVVPQNASAVYLESLTGQAVLEQAAQIEQYSTAFADITAHAMDPAASRAHLQETLAHWQARLSAMPPP